MKPRPNAFEIASESQIKASQIWKKPASYLLFVHVWLQLHCQRESAKGVPSMQWLNRKSTVLNSLKTRFAYIMIIW